MIKEGKSIFNLWNDMNIAEGIFNTRSEVEKPAVYSGVKNISEKSKQN